MFHPASSSADADEVLETTDDHQWGCNFFTAIAGFEKFGNLTYHREFLQFAVRCHNFDYFYPLASKLQHRL